MDMRRARGAWRHIECFDNSNFQGSFPVSAMVCFRDGKPSKKDYRHYNVKTVKGIDDFATMKEVVGRRYKRLMEEGMDLPQLVIIDGGKGQLGAALALLLCTVLGVSAGNGALLMVLAASASYIAVPAVVRHAIPEANPSLYIGMSLGLTFPFNILIGIPIYVGIAHRALQA